MSELSPVAICKGVKVPPSPFLNETRIKRIEAAQFEGEEIAGALCVVREGDRVLEIGAGIGIVGAVTASHARPEAVLSFEANPSLIPHIERLYALNGLEDRIEVRNQVVTASPQRPETMTFHVRTGLAESASLDQGARRTTPVEVPTVSFDAVTAEFRPDVLIMNIDGGELDFLNHAELTGIRAVVVEFHPDLYGKRGAKDCKDALRRAGFSKIDAASSRFVWTCTRPDWAANPRNVPPQPDQGWATELRILKDAIAKPAETGDLSAPSGVLTADGEDVPEAALWRKHRRVNLPFTRPEGDVARLDGRWLWGGVLYRNFAHFVAESQGRLWGVDAAEGYLSGILFIPRRAGTDESLASFQTGFLETFGLDLPIRVLRAPTEVEELVVPGQGFGLGAISAGTEAFRKFTHSRFGAGIVPEGPDKLYISRSQLGPSRGALLGEDLLEAHLRDEGYEIFCPEQHDIATQIARYKAARQVIASEGSALHVFAYCGRADQEVAILCRRRSSATALIARHLESFTGRAPLVIDHLCGVWNNVDSHRKRLAVGEQDFAAVHEDLANAGFVTAGAPWPRLTEDYVTQRLGNRYERQWTEA